MKTLFHDIVSQFGKTLAQELLKTKQEQVKLVPSQSVVEVPVLSEQEPIIIKEKQEEVHPFTEKDYLRFIELFSKYKNYSFEDIKNLKKLHLDYREISDLSPLKNLVNLKKLDLNYNRITDISLLQNLVKLEYLDLRVNRITDISPLKNLVKLERLSMIGNRISDITPLQNLVNLKLLILCSNLIPQQQIDELQKALPKCNIDY